MRTDRSRLNRTVLIMTILLFGMAFSLSADRIALGMLGTAKYQLCFSHAKGTKSHCDTMLIEHINAAKNSVLVQAYSFTSAPIAESLTQATKRGVKVVLVIDKSQMNTRYSQVQRLLDMAVPVYVDYRPAIAHNKVMVFDGRVIETGSYNFTKSAEYRNAENMLIIRDKQLAEGYTDNIYTRIEQSVPVNAYCQQHRCRYVHYSRTNKNDAAENELETSRDIFLSM